MYQQFRTELLTMLLDEVPSESAERIIDVVDRVAYNYDFLKKETGVALYKEDKTHQLVKMYIATKAIAGKSKGTIDRYKNTLNNLFNVLDTEKDITDFDANDCRAMLFFYQKRTGCSNRTLEGIRLILNGFYNWLHLEGYIQASPMGVVEIVKYEKKKKDILSEDEVELMRDACTNEKQLAIFDVLYSTGCRVEELVGITRSDVDLDEMKIKLHQKGNKEGWGYLTERAAESIKAVLPEAEDERVFKMSSRNVELIIGKICKSAGIEKHITPHSIRRSFASNAIENGMPVTDIQKCLGHENINTTMIYAQVSDKKVQQSHKEFVH